MRPRDARAFLFDIQMACQLIRGYASVSNPVVWGILEGDLPGLAAKVEELLARDAGIDPAV